MHDPSYCSMVQSRPPLLPAVIDSYPIDCSPYGVRGMGGGAEDWCADRFFEPSVDAERVLRTPEPEPGDGSMRSARGGVWSDQIRTIRRRSRMEPNYRLSFLGFRGVYTP